MSTTPETNRTMRLTSTHESPDGKWIVSPGLFAIRSSRYKHNAPAFLYVIGMVDSLDHVKIGIATDIQQRVVELQTANPFRLTLLASKAFASKREARHSERALHQQFSNVRATGEWFRLTDESRNSLIDSIGRTV